MSTWVLRGTVPGSALETINARSTQTVGVSQQTVANLGRSALAVGVSVEQAPILMRAIQSAGITLTSLVSGAPKVPVQTLGVVLSNKASGGPTPQQAVGAELVRAKYDLIQTTYATSQVSTGTWNNGANAVGPNNSTLATNANTTVNAASGSLTLSFAPQVNKTELVISSVRFHNYWKHVAGVLVAVTWLSEYSVDGGTNWTTINTGTTSFDQTVTPSDIDFTSIIGQDWAKLTNLKIRLTLTGSASATPSTLSVDAVKLVVTASKTDLL